MRIKYIGTAGGGVWRTRDAGATWSPLFDRQLLLGIGEPGGIAIDPNNTDIVYVGTSQRVLLVTMEGTTSLPSPAVPVDPLALFVSKDQGVTWTQAAAGPTLTAAVGGTQGGYSFHIAIDPASPGDGANDIIYFGAVRQAVSTNSGGLFTAPVSSPHPDTHAWAFVPQPSPMPSIAYIGCDGGIFRSVDQGAHWNQATDRVNAGGLQTALFYNIDLSPDATASVTVGALQDNEIETTAAVTSPLGWNGTSGGDGWDVVFDGKIPNQVYASSGFYSAPCTQVFRSTDNGQTFSTNVTPWTTATDTGCFLAPVATDPSTGGIVYVSGSQNLWQSRNAGSPPRPGGSSAPSAAMSM